MIATEKKVWVNRIFDLLFKIWPTGAFWPMSPARTYLNNFFKHYWWIMWVWSQLDQLNLVCVNPIVGD